MTVEKILRVGDLREVLNLLHGEEISFSRMVEILNEKIDERIKSRNKVMANLASQAPLWNSTKEEDFDYCTCKGGNKAGFVALDEGRLGCGICGKPF